MELVDEGMRSLMGVSPVGAALWVICIGVLVVAYKALALAAIALKRRGEKDE